MKADRKSKLIRYRNTVHVVGVLGIVAIIGLAVGLGYLPLRRERNSIRQRMTADVRVLEKRAEIKALHAKFQGRLAASEKNLERLLTRVPEEPQESEFLAQLANLARRSGLSLDDFRPGDPRWEGKFGEVEIRFTATGTYDQICRFVQGLDDTPRFCRVNSLKIAAKDPQDEVYPLEVSLLVFFSGEAKNNT